MRRCILDIPNNMIILCTCLNICIPCKCKPRGNLVVYLNGNQGIII